MTPETFDERAATWDDEEHLRRASLVAELLRTQLPLSPTTRLLDYGAGTGLLSQHLVADVGHLVVADPSAGMREVARGKVATGVLPGAEVIDLDLGRDPAPADLEVDVIATMMALHHVPDLPPVLAAFARLLTPTGHLAIVDLEAEDGSFHGEDFHGHDGFEPDQLTAWLTDAGFEVPRFQPAMAVTKDERTYGLFLAVTQRADAAHRRTG